MTARQFARWKRVSLGLVKASPKERRREVREHVSRLIDAITWGEQLEDIQDWDGNTGTVYVCDRADEYLWENGLEDEVTDAEGWSHSQRTPVGDDVSACVRAGFDIAVAPSAGVIGFTIADLRNVFGRGRIPKWVREFFDPPLRQNERGRAGVWL